jgi:hypothetical protein
VQAQLESQQVLRAEQHRVSQRRLRKRLALLRLRPQLLIH